MIEAFKTLTRDPEKVFREPRHLLERQDIAPADKLLLLEDWQTDLLELQRAEDENMPSAQREPDRRADDLAKVTEAITLVRKQLARKS